jgi:hypothetical protein
MNRILSYLSIAFISIVLSSCLPTNIQEIECTFDAVLRFSCDSIWVETKGGVGPFAYDWPVTGGSTRAIPLKSVTTANNFSDRICVNVKDNGVSKCQRQYCYPYIGHMEVVLNPECNVGGSANGRIAGSLDLRYRGPKNLSYKWSTGDTLSVLSNAPAGNYCVTITAKENKCSASKCVELKNINLASTSNVGAKPYRFTMESSTFAAGAVVGSSVSKPHSFTYPVNLEIPKTHYNFECLLNNNTCAANFKVKLPQYPTNKLQATAISSPTCTTCSDGGFKPVLVTDGECYLCEIGTLSIFRDNNLDKDLIADVENKLTRGKYYLVLTDKNKGNWISHIEVVIN